jgi:hypothetical protein
MQTVHDDSAISQETNYRTFEPKLYRDQKAKSEFIFKRRTKSEAPEKNRSETAIKEEIVA